MGEPEWVEGEWVGGGVPVPSRHTRLNLCMLVHARSILCLAEPAHSCSSLPTTQDCCQRIVCCRLGDGVVASSYPYMLHALLCTACYTRSQHSRPWRTRALTPSPLQHMPAAIHTSLSSPALAAQLHRFPQIQQAQQLPQQLPSPQAQQVQQPQQAQQEQQRAWQLDFELELQQAQQLHHARQAAAQARPHPGPAPHPSASAPMQRAHSLPLPPMQQAQKLPLGQRAQSLPQPPQPAQQALQSPQPEQASAAASPPPAAVQAAVSAVPPYDVEASLAMLAGQGGRLFRGLGLGQPWPAAQQGQQQGPAQEQGPVPAPAPAAEPPLQQGAPGAAAADPLLGLGVGSALLPSIFSLSFRNCIPSEGSLFAEWPSLFCSAGPSPAVL